MNKSLSTFLEDVQFIVHDSDSESDRSFTAALI